MAQINLKLDEEQLARTDYLAGEVHRTRASYIREAITEYNTRTERELLAARLFEVSAKVRDESLAVSREMEPAESDGSSIHNRPAADEPHCRRR